MEGINVIWGFFPWKRAFYNAEVGTSWDVSAVWWPSKKTKNKFLISEPVVKTSFVFFHLRTRKFDWNSFEDLKGLSIGITRGYYYGEAFDDAIKRKIFKTQTVNQDEQNYLKLIYKRIDIFPNDLLVGLSQIKNVLSPPASELLTFHPKEFKITTLNLIISKKCKKGKFFLDKFNSGLKKLKESGKKDQMLDDVYKGKYNKKKQFAATNVD